MNRKDFRPNDEYSSSSNVRTLATEYDLSPQYDSRKDFYGKAKVRNENGKIILRSYQTDVAYIEDGKATVTGTYSPTTLRHIKEFLKQHGYKADNSSQILHDYVHPTLEEKKEKDYSEKTKNKSINKQNAESNNNIYRSGGIKYIVSSNRWRDKINGNTYYTIAITDADTGEQIYKSEMDYGYGEQYRHTAKDYLIKTGRMKKEDNTNHELIRQKIYFEEQKDVNKRDL